MQAYKLLARKKKLFNEELVAVVDRDSEFLITCCDFQEPSNEVSSDSLLTPYGGKLFGEKGQEV